MVATTDELTLEQENDRLRRELAAERERADAFADTIARQSERIFTLQNLVRSLKQGVGDAA